LKIGLRHYLTVAFTIVATVPVLVLGLWVEKTSMEKELAAVSEKHLLLATSTTAALDRYARDAKGVFSLFAESVHSRASPAELDLAQKFGFRYIHLHAPDGSEIARMSFDEAADNGISPQIFKVLYGQSGDEAAFSPVMDDGAGAPTLFLTKRLATGQLAIGALNLDYIRKMQSAISFGRKGHSAIVDRRGNTMAHPRPEWQQQITNLSAVKPVELMMAGKSGVAKFFSPAMGKDMITGYSTVPETGWGVMVPQPLEELEERAGDVKKMALGLIVIGLVAAALISWALAGLLVRPLEAVINAARWFSKGYLDTRVQAMPDGYPQEFRDLGSSVNAMIRDVAKGIVEREDAERDLQITHDHLGHMTNRLQNLNRELESRVEERSSDLLEEINQRSELAEALQLSNLRLKDFAESASDWFWEMDENLRWSYFSDKFTLITGISTDQLLGRTFEESGVFDETDRPCQAHMAELQAHHAFRNFEHYLTRANGESVYVSISANPIFDENGAFAGYRGTGTDVTERRMLDRMKTEFITTVSHELRTPLTSIHGALGLLASDVFGSLSGEANGLLEIAKLNSDRLLKVIDDVLDVEKLEKGILEIDYRPVNLSKLVADTVAEHAGLSRKQNIDIQLLDPAPDLKIQGDARRLAQAIGNLLSNAVKFSDDGRAVEVALTRDGDRARISIHDSGPGIPKIFRDHIFDRFALVDSSDRRQVGGTGLGLYIAKSIIDRHQGSIGFQSEEGVGSTFFIELPITAN